MKLRTSSRLGVVAVATAFALTLAGCSSSASSDSAPAKAAPNAATGGGSAEFCNWFPQADLPNNPSPAPTPYGPPSDAASLQKLRDDVTAKYATLSHRGQYCSSGQSNQQGPIDPAL
ncbi:MAG: hypothetical protein WBZ04_08240, partial [Candidatus Nanopelagicales bacterium]